MKLLKLHQTNHQSTVHAKCFHYWVFSFTNTYFVFRLLVEKTHSCFPSARGLTWLEVWYPFGATYHHKFSWGKCRLWFAMKAKQFAQMEWNWRILFFCLPLLYSFLCPCRISRSLGCSDRGTCSSNHYSKLSDYSKFQLYQMHHSYLHMLNLVIEQIIFN